MHEIKKLILKEWYKFFLASMVLLFVLMSISNLISGLLRSNVSGYEVLMNYIIEVPSFMSKILPLSCLTASLFSINKLKDRNELTALFSLGYSRKNFVITILQASSIIAIINFFNSAYIQPFFNENKYILIPNINKFKNLNSEGLRSSTIGSGKIWYKGDSYFFSFTAFDKETNSIMDLAIYEYSTNHKLTQITNAKKAVYRDPEWVFYEGKTMNNLNNLEFPQIESFTTKVFPLLERPSDFEKIEADITTLDIVKLNEYIKSLDEVGINTSSYKVTLLDKFSTSLICCILALVASMSIFNPNRRSSSFGKSVLFTLVFAILYWLIYSYTFELGRSSKVNPYVATFIMPLIFTLFLIYNFFRYQKIR